MYRNIEKKGTIHLQRQDVMNESRIRNLYVQLKKETPAT